MITIETTDRRPLPPGPHEPVELNVDEATFRRLGEELPRYGSIYKVDRPGREVPVYVLNHPDLVQRGLATNRRNYVKGLGFERVRLLLGNGLITSEGDYWLRQRRMMQPAFQRSNIAAMCDVMREVNVERAHRWQRLAEDGASVNITHETSEIARGDFFATAEVLVHLGWMAPQFRLRYVEDRPLELAPAVNLRRKHGIHMKIEKR